MRVSCYAEWNRKGVRVRDWGLRAADARGFCAHSLLKRQPNQGSPHTSSLRVNKQNV